MSWTHLEDTHPKGRKDYQCYLCEEVIPKGEVHVRRSGVSDGDLDSFRMHAACEAKTHDWDESSWECHDASEFRDYELKGVPEEEEEDAGEDL